MPPPPNCTGKFHREGQNSPVKLGGGHFHDETKSTGAELEGLSKSEIFERGWVQLTLTGPRLCGLFFLQLTFGPLRLTFGSQSTSGPIDFRARPKVVLAARSGLFLSPKVNMAQFLKHYDPTTPHN